MVWRSWIFVLDLVTFLYSLSAGDRAILLERPKPGGGTDSWYWKTSRKDGHAGWTPQTSTDTGSRVYTVCDVNVWQPSNWLWSDGIGHNNLKRIDLAIDYTIRRCTSFLGGRLNCSEQFGVYGYQSNGNLNESNTDPRNGFYNKVKVISMPSNTSSKVKRVQGIAKLSLFIKERTSKVFFAIHDQGACLVVHSFVVTYNVCPERTLPTSLVLLPQTIAPVNESEIVKIRGKCAENSQPAAPVLSAICSSRGEWTQSDDAAGKCLCLPGWEKIGTECQACPLGYFKEKPGNTKCSKCPANSNSDRSRKRCKCSRKFFRAPRERASDNCTAPPSAPKHLRSLFTNQTTVSLEWSHPRHLGGRSDLHYEIECKIVCRKDQRSCSQDCGSQVLFLPRQSNLSQTKAIVTNLLSRTVYRFKVHAKNGVSGKAEMEGIPSRFTELDVTTLESAPDQPVVTVQRIDSTSVNVSWNLKTGHEGILFFLVRYRKLGDGADNYHTINTTKAYIKVTGLEPDVEYEFVVVAKNSRGFGPISQGVKTPQDYSVPSLDDDKKLLFLIAAAVGGVLLFIIITAIVSFALSRRRRTRNRANTFEDATELFSNHGLSQYVDPSNYGDPMEAVKTFAAEIDRCLIKLESRVGGGEFAEVFKGLHEDCSVAVKILKQGSSSKNRDDFISEASIMGQFKNPNVIQLIGVVTVSRPMMIVTEFMEGGSLDKFLKDHEDKLTALQLVGMVRGVASGMLYLSSMNFIHRDLAARNVLVGNNMVCKVSDFGLSRELEDNPDSEYQTQGGKIPIRWTAPEAMRYRKFSTSSDVWSYGIVLWEAMSFGERPYWDWSNFEVMDRVEGGYRLPAPMKCPKIVYGIMMDCWDRDRTRRPNFEEIVKRLNELIRSPEMLNDNLVCYTSAVSADFTKLSTIQEWLVSIHMGQYIANFKTAGYSDLTQVTHLKDGELKDIGVTLIGHRNKIYKSIKSMRKHFDNLPEPV